MREPGITITPPCLPLCLCMSGSRQALFPYGLQVRRLTLELRLELLEVILTLPTSSWGGGREGGRGRGMLTFRAAA